MKRIKDWLVGIDEYGIHCAEPLCTCEMESSVLIDAGSNLTLANLREVISDHIDDRIANWLERRREEEEAATQQPPRSPKNPEPCT